MLRRYAATTGSGASNRNARDLHVDASDRSSHLMTNDSSSCRRGGYAGNRAFVLRELDPRSDAPSGTWVEASLTHRCSSSLTVIVSIVGEPFVPSSWPTKPSDCSHPPSRLFGHFGRRSRSPMHPYGATRACRRASTPLPHELRTAVRRFALHEVVARDVELLPGLRVNPEHLLHPFAFQRRCESRRRVVDLRADRFSSTSFPIGTSPVRGAHERSYGWHAVHCCCASGTADVEPHR